MTLRLFESFLKNQNEENKKESKLTQVAQLLVIKEKGHQDPLEADLLLVITSCRL